MNEKKEKTNFTNEQLTQEAFLSINETAMKPFDELTFSDSFLFGEVMMDETTCKNVLEIILGIEIEKVVLVEKEKQANNTPEFKSIRMDIYVKDLENTIYNVEMQVKNKNDTPKRSRYYQGLLDTNILPSGSKSYNVLNKSFVIFICHFDPFNAGKCCYTFEERCLEDLSIPLGDETQKIFLNTAGKNRNEIPLELAEFLDYLKNPKIKLQNKKILELDNRVKQIKIDAKVRSRYMTLKEWLDDMCEEEKEFARARGLAEGRAEGITLGRAEGITLGRTEGITLGRTEGRAEGIALGRTEGIAAGRTIGETKGKVELIRRIYLKGYDVETTADLLEQEVSYVADIYTLLKKYPTSSDEEIATIYLENKEITKE